MKEHITSNPYEFDLDQNGFPSFTKKNFLFVEALIMNDSNYRSDGEASSEIILKKGFPRTMKEVVEKIDKENSTHLSVSGTKPGDNHGREITVKFLEEMANLEERIKNGKLEVVDEIAKCVNNRYNLSFASKFCTYTNRICFNKDDYSIFDSVIFNILPYYIYIMKIGEYKTEKKIRESMKNKQTGKVDYLEYHKYINSILDEANKNPDVNATRKSIDWLLWYYYKGQNSSRIKKALACIGK